jgi:hypothetical protein
MTDDLKQRADAAWVKFAPYLYTEDALTVLRAAVEDSIQAALAPVVERVQEACLFVDRVMVEHKHCRACGFYLAPNNRPLADGCPCNSARGVNHGLVERLVCTCKECDPEQTGSSRWREPPPAEAKCAECPMCGGPKAGNGWICGPPDWKGWPEERQFGERGCSGPDCTDRNRRHCPSCTKPEARQAMCTQHDTPYPCVQCGDLAAPTPSAQKAPERVWIRSGGSAREWALVFDSTIGPLQMDHVEYVRADVHTRECSTQRLIGLKESEGIHAKTAALLAAANARVEELEKIAEGAIGIGRREGRAAGIREAAEAVHRLQRDSASLPDYRTGWNAAVAVCGAAILTLLTKPEEKR